MPFAKVKDINMYYEVHGEGVPLLLISGTGGSHLGWMVNSVPRFKKHFKVIVYDHRGTGQSDKPDMAYSTRLFASDAAGLLDVIGISEPAHVMGGSMGGRVAQWVALDYPQKVRSLVLACTGPGAYDDFEPTRGIPLHLAMELAEMGYGGYRKHHFAEEFMFPKEFAEAHPEVVQKRLEVYEKDVTPLKPYLRHVIARQQHQTTELLHRITAPTLVIDGAEDNVIRGTGNHVRTSQVLAEKIPNARLVLIPGCAHAFLWQEPELSHNTIIDFLLSH